MIQLGQTDDGRLIIASNQELPSKIKRVEYYREQKLFTFAFEDEDEEDILMPYEVSDEISDIIKGSPNVIIIAMAEEGQERLKYLVPLVQIGV